MHCLKRLSWLTASSFIWPMRSHSRQSEGHESEAFILPVSSLEHHHELAVYFTQGHASVRQASPHFADSASQVFFFSLQDCNRSLRLPFPENWSLLFDFPTHCPHICKPSLYETFLKFPNLNLLFPIWALMIIMTQLWWIVSPLLIESPIFQRKLDINSCFFKTVDLIFLKCPIQTKQIISVWQIRPRQSATSAIYDGKLIRWSTATL